MEQAILLDEMTEPAVTMCIEFVVPEDEIKRRVLDRWIHNASGRTYDVSFNPPKQHLVDDETGEPLTRRLDDGNVSIYWSN